MLLWRQPKEIVKDFLDEKRIHSRAGCDQPRHHDQFPQRHQHH